MLVRALLTASMALALAPASGGSAAQAGPDRLAAIERASVGRLGVALLDGEGSWMDQAFAWDDEGELISEARSALESARTLVRRQ